ncbi:MAG: SDR family oxidoreductase [Janthinobacterium lividum]
MAKILITGIAGFIGSSLARTALEQGAEVVGLDDLSAGKLENLEEIRSRIDFRAASILDPSALRDACRGVDYVFHEAAVASVPKSVDAPLETNDINLNGTLQVLEASRIAGVKRLMYAASSAAYGNAPEQPKTESMLPDPVSPYAVQKVAGEMYLSSYARVYGLETVSLRYFNIFGPRQDPSSQYSGVLARFISLMMRGEAPTIFGDGLTSRDFTYIDNVVSANLLAAKAPAAVSGKIFNVATGKRVTLLDAFEAIKSITGYDGDLNFQPERNGDVKHSLADISLSRRMLNYEVVADLHYGLEKTIDWYKSESVQQEQPAALLAR